MPVKVLLLLKRKAGMTPAEFRAEYENGHSRLGLKLLGHLWTQYRRNYVGASNSFADGSIADDSAAGNACGYDVITELVYRDMAALEESNRIYNEPENKRLITEDEDRLFDREATLSVVCEVKGEDDLDYDWSGWVRNDPTYRPIRKTQR